MKGLINILEQAKAEDKVVMILPKGWLTGVSTSDEESVNLPQGLEDQIRELYPNSDDYNEILKRIKVEGDDIIFKCGVRSLPGKFIEDSEGWKMEWDAYPGDTYTISGNLTLDNCVDFSITTESVKGLANILLEQPNPDTEDPDDSLPEETPSEETPSEETPSETEPEPERRYTPRSRCVEELSNSYFCLKCNGGDNIDECNQLGNQLYEGSCNIFDRENIARELSQKMACIGMKPIKKSSLKVIGNKLYFSGEKRDQETKMDFQLKKVIDGNNIQWMYKDEDGGWKDFIEQYHVNETFLKNKFGLEILLEKYRRN